MSTLNKVNHFMNQYIIKNPDRSHNGAPVEIDDTVSATGCPAMAEVYYPDVFYPNPDPFVIAWDAFFKLPFDLFFVPGYKMIPRIGLFRFRKLKIAVP